MRTWLWAAVLLLCGGLAQAAPGPVEHDWTVRDFAFHTGQSLPELRIHYRTLGEPGHPAVLILHGTAGSGAAMLAPSFAGELFGPGQPLDAAKYFIILPDAIGAGGSSKPSDGLRAGFPAYDYTDMVTAQYRLVTEGLGLHHLRLVLGYSMGGMQTWMWAETYPAFADGWVPMAAQPSAMASRNWMMRRMLIESIKRDPAYKDGNYTEQPPAMRAANVMFGIGTVDGVLADQARAPTAAQADAVVDQLLAAPPPADANDFIWQWQSSHDYDTAPGLSRITRPVLAINSADDPRNPPESGIMDRAMAQLPSSQYVLIPASAETRGHGTGMIAHFWVDRFRTFFATLPEATP